MGSQPPTPAWEAPGAKGSGDPREIPSREELLPPAAASCAWRCRESPRGWGRRERSAPCSAPRQPPAAASAPGEPVGRTSPAPALSGCSRVSGTRLRSPKGSTAAPSPNPAPTNPGGTFQLGFCCWQLGDLGEERQGKILGYRSPQGQEAAGLSHQPRTQPPAGMGGTQRAPGLLQQPRPPGEGMSQSFRLDKRRREQLPRGARRSWEQLCQTEA